jgi:hypothetical protein
VSAQGLTYPQKQAPTEHSCSSRAVTPRNRDFLSQVIDSSDFSDDASNLSDLGGVSVNQVFGGAASSFPTKLSTEAVGDFKKPFGS